MKQAPTGSTYFNCVLQGQHAARKAVCFSPRKHKLINNVSESCSPVKILKMKINNNDSIINDSTQISLVPKASFEVDKRFKSDAIIKLGDLICLAPGQIVSVRCHVRKVYSETSHKTRNGDVGKQDVIVSDSTNSVKLILYGNDVSTLTEGKSYLIKNVRFNRFKDTVYLNTTMACEFSYEEIDKIDHMNDSSASTEATILCKIVGVASVNLYTCCINCNKKMQPNDEEEVLPFLKCGECNSCMLKSSCNVILNLSIVVSDVAQNDNVTIFFANDEAYQLKSIIGFTCSSENELVKSLLSFANIFQVTFDITSKKVVSVV